MRAAGIEPELSVVCVVLIVVPWMLHLAPLFNVLPKTFYVMFRSRVAVRGNVRSLKLCGFCAEQEEARGGERLAAGRSMLMGSVEEILDLKDFSDSGFRIEFGSMRWQGRVLKFSKNKKAVCASLSAASSALAWLTCAQHPQ